MDKAPDSKLQDQRQTDSLARGTGSCKGRLGAVINRLSGRRKHCYYHPNLVQLIQLLATSATSLPPPGCSSNWYPPATSPL